MLEGGEYGVLLLLLGLNDFPGPVDIKPL
ncbi:hypothetical protein LCGC14_2761670, partial [marine sediment metagenome]